MKAVVNISAKQVAENKSEILNYFESPYFSDEISIVAKSQVIVGEITYLFSLMTYEVNTIKFTFDNERQAVEFKLRFG